MTEIGQFDTENSKLAISDDNLNSLSTVQQASDASVDKILESVDMKQEAESRPPSHLWIDIFYNPFTKFTNAFELTQKSEIVSYVNGQIIVYKGSRQAWTFPTQHISHIVSLQAGLGEDSLTLCMASGDSIVFSRGGSVIHEFKLDSAEPTQAETSLYRDFLDVKITLPQLLDHLQTISKKISLSWFSLECVRSRQLITEVMMRAVKLEWLNKPSYIVYMTSLKKIMADDGPSHLVVATETGSILVISCKTYAILAKFSLPSVAMSVVAVGHYDLAYRIYVSCRNGSIVALNGDLNQIVVNLFSPPVGMVHFDSYLYVACMDSKIHCIDPDRKQVLYQLKVSSTVTCLDTIHIKSRNKSYLAVGLASKEVCVFHEKSHVSTVHLEEIPMNMRFGEYAGEKSMLVVVGRDGGLMVKMLKRSSIALFEQRIGQGPPAEQDIPLPLPKKSKFHLDQRERAKKDSVAIYQKSQRDLAILKLYVLRDLARSTRDDAQAPVPASVNIKANVKMHIKLLNFDNLFELVFQLENISHSDAISGCLLTLSGESSVTISQPVLRIPMLVPQRGINVSTRVQSQAVSAMSSGPIKVCLVQQLAPGLTRILLSARVDLDNLVLRK